MGSADTRRKQGSPGEKDTRGREEGGEGEEAGECW